MSKSARQMAKDCGLNEKTIRSYIKKGYFGEINQDSRNRYILPDDMPFPYVASARTERDSTLLKAFVDASDLGRFVNKGMFPKIDELRYHRILDYAVNNHLVEVHEKYPGVYQFLSTEEGRAILSTEPKVQKQIYDQILTGVKIAALLAEFGIKYGPAIVTMLQATA